MARDTRELVQIRIVPPGISGASEKPIGSIVREYHSRLLHGNQNDS
jgi:hypothetical protein